jgi:hypothetical protein
VFLHHFSLSNRTWDGHFYDGIFDDGAFTETRIEEAGIRVMKLVQQNKTEAETAERMLARVHKRASERSGC